MSPAAALHAQLASIMEVLANTAVAEICELVDSGYSVLQLEISRSRKENEVLRRKLRLMELRAARATALRAAVTAGCTARAQLSAHHNSGEARRKETAGGNTGGRSLEPPRLSVTGLSSSYVCTTPAPDLRPFYNWHQLINRNCLVYHCTRCHHLSTLLRD